MTEQHNRAEPGGEIGPPAEWPRPRWVCPHDPVGNDPDTATYCPQAIRSTVPFGRCDVPPAGWRCTREPGHDGPCAAVPT